LGGRLSGVLVWWGWGGGGACVGRGSAADRCGVIGAGGGFAAER